MIRSPFAVSNGAKTSFLLDRFRHAGLLFAMFGTLFVIPLSYTILSTG
jgi:hypothetical protein